MEIVALIPSRLNSTRFPNKPLALLRGKPMIQHVYERTCTVPDLSRIIVATPDERIAEVVRGFDGEAMLTTPTCPTGTDAIAQIADRLTADIVVNVQGDLPYFHTLMVEQAIASLMAAKSASMATVITRIQNVDEFRHPDIVKVTFDREGYALYFSRAPIPHLREYDARIGLLAYRHIGIYVYWRSFLLRFSQLSRTPLEQCESLEQLRALGHGYKIVVSETNQPTLEIDTSEDLARAEAFLRQEMGAA